LKLTLSPDTQTWCPPEPPVLPSQNRRQLIGCEPSSLRHTGWRRIAITGLLRNMLTAHFSDPLLIEDPDLKSLLWRPGDNTGIMIESVFRYRAALADKRPAILIKGNARQNLRVLRGDRQGADQQGNYVYTTLWVGSHSIHCINGSGAACELLADEVQREITQFGPSIVDNLGLKKFMVLDVDGVAIVEEATQNFTVPVNVGWAYQESWKLSQEALTLSRVNLEFDVSKL